MLNKSLKSHIKFIMLVDIYYSIGVLIILLLISLLIKWKKIQNIIEWHEKFQKITKSIPKQETSEKRVTIIYLSAQT
jgi:hypothetical protein